MTKKIDNLGEFLENLQTQVATYKTKLTQLEEGIKVNQFDFELRKADLLTEINNSLRGFFPTDLDLELPVDKILHISDNDIEAELSKMYQI